MIDLHSHILPELDDGARSWEDALKMAQMAVDDGVTQMVATPHMLPDGTYANRTPQVLAQVDALQQRLQEAGIPLRIVPGGELYIFPQMTRAIEQGELLTYGNQRRYALIELPAHEVPPYTEQTFFELQVMGIKPILAHVERYPALTEDTGRLEEWLERGLLLQVNGRSLLGESGKQVQRAAQELVERHMVHFVASDAHGTSRRPPGLAKARERVEQIAGPELAHAVVSENPRRVLAGEAVLEWEVQKPKRRSWFARILGRE